MRAILLVAAAALTGCWDKPKPATPIPPENPIGHLEPTCTDASIGIDRGTQDLRGPDHPVGDAMRTQCLESGWPSAAIACFAKMKTSELGECAKRLSEKQRDAVLDAIAGTDQASVAIALVKLSTLKVGIAECDSFVSTVTVVLGCDAMPIEDRVQLGIETSDMWSLPADKLKPEMQQRMGAVCKHSLDDLVIHARNAGCM